MPDASTAFRQPGAASPSARPPPPPARDLALGRLAVPGPGRGGAAGRRLGASACATASAARRCASPTPASRCWPPRSRATAPRATRTRRWSAASRSRCSAPAASRGAACRCACASATALGDGDARPVLDPPHHGRGLPRADRPRDQGAPRRPARRPAPRRPRARPTGRSAASAGTCSPRASARRRRARRLRRDGRERGGVLDVLRPAPRRALRLPFATWMALRARDAGEGRRLDDAQALGATAPARTPSPEADRVRARPGLPRPHGPWRAPARPRRDDNRRPRRRARRLPPTSPVARQAPAAHPYPASLSRRSRRSPRPPRSLRRSVAAALALAAALRRLRHAAARRATAPPSTQRRLAGSRQRRRHRRGLRRRQGAEQAGAAVLGRRVVPAVQPGQGHAVQPPGLRRAVERFVPCTSTATPGAQKLGARFKVVGYPTLILFNPDRKELTRLPGEVDAGALMQVLQLGMKRARPVGAGAGRRAAPASRSTGSEWRLLAFYSWDTDERAGRRRGAAAGDAARSWPTPARPTSPRRACACAEGDRRRRREEAAGARRRHARPRVAQVLADPAPQPRAHGRAHQQRRRHRRAR